MNGMIKDATVKRDHDDQHEQLSTHLEAFAHADNVASRFKTLNDVSPCDFICQCWPAQPERCSQEPIHQMPRLSS